MGADSASTDATSGTKSPVIKIQQIGKYPVLVGGSGDVGLIQRIIDDLNGVTLNCNGKFKDTRRAIKDCVLPLMRETAGDFIALPLQGFNVPPTATLMFGCIQHKVPLILEIEMGGGDTIYGDNYGSFNAIGSGKPWAQAIMRPHVRTQRDLELGKIQAYRTLEDSIQIAASGLAPPIHLYTLDLKGTVTELDPTELKKLERLCELWRELEREALGHLLSPEENVDTAIPEPEETLPPQTN